MSQKIVEKILDFAKKNGATSAEVMLEKEEGFSVGVRMGEAETLEFHEGKSLSLTVYCGHRSTSVSTMDFSDEALLKIAKNACEMARFVEEDPYAGLADKELMAENYPDIGCFESWSILPGEAIEQAIKAEQAGFQSDSQISNSDGVNITTVSSHSTYANTHGFLGEIKASSHSMSASFIAKSHNEDMQTGSEYTVSYTPTQLESFESVAIKAAREAVSQLNPQKIATQNVPVIFDASISASLIGAFFNAINGNALYREASFLLNALEKDIFPQWFNILEDPHVKNQPGSSPFDLDGVLTRKKLFIENGRLKSYMLNSYTARRLGMQTTANAGGAFNISLPVDKKYYTETQEALLKKMDKGVLVTSLMGSSINMITGDYSRGATGFWVENGEIQYPIQEFTIASCFQDMFLNIVSLANDIDSRRNIKVGSILLSEMMVAGS